MDQDFDRIGNTGSILLQLHLGNTGHYSAGCRHCASADIAFQILSHVLCAKDQYLRKRKGISYFCLLYLNNLAAGGLQWQSSVAVGRSERSGLEIPTEASEDHDLA
jgi:hypothetical protein